MEPREDLEGLIQEKFQESLSQGGSPAEAYFGVGHRAMIEEESDKAILAFEKSIAADPRYTLSHHFLGIVYADMGENEKAIQYFQKCIALGCRGIDPNIQEENSYYHMGWCYEDLGRLEEAKAAFRQGITHVPRHYEGYRRLGRLLQKQEAYAEAATVYQQALEICAQHEPGLLDRILLKNIQYNFDRPEPATICGIPTHARRPDHRRQNPRGEAPPKRREAASGDLGTSKTVPRAHGGLSPEYEPTRTGAAVFRTATPGARKKIARMCVEFGGRQTTKGAGPKYNQGEDLCNS